MTSMRRRWVLVGLIVVVVGSVAGYAFARSGPNPKHKNGWWAYPPVRTGHGSSAAASYPITSLAPGKVILARLHLHSGAPYFIYGQRIRFQHRLYFCLSAGSATGSFQTCPPWPLAQGKTDLLLGGGGGFVELALDINAPGQQCTFVGIPAGPYRASGVPLPAALKIRGDLYYSFVKRPPGDGVPRSTKSGTSVQFTIGGSGRARCRPAASPPVDPAVALQLSVFSRPQIKADMLPAAFRGELQQVYGNERPDFADARQVKASDGQTAYLVPTKAGVCVINTNEMFCSLAASLPGAAAVDLCSPALPPGQLEMEWLLPDGATNVAVGMATGATTRFAPGHNVYIARLPISGPLPQTIEWDAGGQHHSVSAGVPSDAHSQTCAHPRGLTAAPKASSKPTVTFETATGPGVPTVAKP